MALGTSRPPWSESFMTLDPIEYKIRFDEDEEVDEDEEK